MHHRKSVSKTPETNGENVSNPDMNTMVKQEKEDSTYTQENFSDENTNDASVPNKTNDRKKRKAPKRVAVKRRRRGKQVKKTPEPVKEESDQQTDDNAEVNSKNSMESNLTKNHTIYTCKLCHKDFSSAFILCLHLQIHQKVANTPVIKENDTPENLSPAEIEEEEVEVETIDVKLEEFEELEDTDDLCSAEVKEEPGTVNTNPVNQILNKNFVESLKKNLSLAMNRKL